MYSSNVLCIFHLHFFIIFFFPGILKNINVFLLLVNFSLLCICFGRNKLKNLTKHKSAKQTSYFVHNS